DVEQQRPSQLCRCLCCGFDTSCVARATDSCAGPSLGFAELEESAVSTQGGRHKMEVRRLLVGPATEADLKQSPMSVPKPWLGEQSTKPGPLTRREIYGSVLWGLLSLVV